MVQISLLIQLPSTALYLWCAFHRASCGELCPWLSIMHACCAWFQGTFLHTQIFWKSWNSRATCILHAKLLQNGREFLLCHLQNPHATKVPPGRPLQSSMAASCFWYHSELASSSGAPGLLSYGCCNLSWFLICLFSIKQSSNAHQVQEKLHLLTISGRSFQILFNECHVNIGEWISGGQELNIYFLQFIFSGLLLQQYKGKGEKSIYIVISPYF